MTTKETESVVTNFQRNIQGQMALLKYTAHILKNN